MHANRYGNYHLKARPAPGQCKLIIVRLLQNNTGSLRCIMRLYWKLSFRSPIIFRAGRILAERSREHEAPDPQAGRVALGAQSLAPSRHRCTGREGRRAHALALAAVEAPREKPSSPPTTAVQPTRENEFPAGKLRNFPRRALAASSRPPPPPVLTSAAHPPEAAPPGETTLSSGQGTEGGGREGRPERRSLERKAAGTSPRQAAGGRRNSPCLQPRPRAACCAHRKARHRTALAKPSASSGPAPASRYFQSDAAQRRKRSTRLRAALPEPTLRRDPPQRVGERWRTEHRRAPGASPTPPPTPAQTRATSCPAPSARTSVPATAAATHGLSWDHCVVRGLKGQPHGARTALARAALLGWAAVASIRFPHNEDPKARSQCKAK